MRKTNIKISIIIVNLNTGNILSQSIKSIYEYETDAELFEVIIVDQNSSDNSREIILGLAKVHKNIKYIFNDSLESFSHANNQGFDKAEGEFVLIMNPDVVFVEPVLNKMLKILMNNLDIGAACPLLLGADGNFQHEYFRKFPGLMQFLLFYMVFSKPFYYSAKARRMFYEIAPNLQSGSQEAVEQIPCAFFFTRYKIYEEVGKMDDKYVLFYEDVDLSFQVNKKYTLILDTTVKVMHYGGSSFSNENNSWLYGRFLISMNYFFDKNYGFIRSLLLKILSVSNSAFIVILEYCKSVFGVKNNYRLLKHSYFLNEFKKVYF